MQKAFLQQAHSVKGGFFSISLYFVTGRAMEGKCDAATKLINSNFEMGLFSRDAIFYLFFPALMIWAIVMGLSHSGTPTRPDSVQIGRVSWITQMVQGTELRPGDRLCVDRTCHQAFSIIEGCKLEFCHGVLCGVVRQFNAHVSMNCQLKLGMDGRVRLTHPTYRTNVDIIPGIFTALRPGADGILYGSLFGGGQDVVIADGSQIKYRSQHGVGPMGPRGGYPFREKEPRGDTGPGGAAGALGLCHHEPIGQANPSPTPGSSILVPRGHGLGPVGQANAEIEKRAKEESSRKAAEAELARQEKELKAFVADEENKMLEELRKRYVEQRKELRSDIDWSQLQVETVPLIFECDRPDGCQPRAIPVPFEIDSLKVTKHKTAGGIGVQISDENDPDEL